MPQKACVTHSAREQSVLLEVFQRESVLKTNFVPTISILDTFVAMSLAREANKNRHLAVFYTKYLVVGVYKTDT